MSTAFQWQGMPSENWARIGADNRQFVGQMCRKHGDLGVPLARDYLRRSSVKNAVEANKRLRALSERLELGDTGLTATVHDEELKKWCERHATEVAATCDEWTQRGSVSTAIHYAQKRVRECGLVFPNQHFSPVPTDQEYGQALARVFDPGWWRRQVRRIQARKIETVAREIRLVSVNTGIYASDATVTRRKAQRQRNREALAALEATSSDGQTLNMLDVVKASTANPENRRNELMVRMRGFEECATAAGDSGLFVTLTTPSRFHAMTVNRKSGRAYANPKFDGSTPREAQAYFCRLWSRIRAQLWREEIRPYGFRIAEPHHDGTPHWHMMIHVRPEQMDRLQQILTVHALADSPDEPGAQKQRVKLVEIDPAKGTAAGYIAKYVSKNIDGEGVDADLYGRDATQSARRIDAWASAWGIRQFQQIGGASVTVWRELRRLQAEQIIASEADPHTAMEVFEAWEAADTADWAAYTICQGGVSVRRDEQLIRAQYQSDGLTRYYEEAVKITGVVARGFGDLCTRALVWVIQKAGTAEKQEQIQRQKWRGRNQRGSSLSELQEMGQAMSLDELQALDDELSLSVDLSGAPAAPWTCVSNCTPSGEQGIRTEKRGCFDVELPGNDECLGATDQLSAFEFKPSVMACRERQAVGCSQCKAGFN